MAARRRFCRAPDRLRPAREGGTESGASDGSRHSGVGFTVGVGEKANGGVDRGGKIGMTPLDGIRERRVVEVG